MEQVKDILIRNMKAMRKTKGWNQSDLANASGYSESFIKDIERGKSWVSPEALETLSQCLGVSIGEFFKDDNNLIELPVSKTIKKFMSVPDDVYDKAVQVELDSDAWDTVRDALDIAIERAKRERKANRT